MEHTKGKWYWDTNYDGQPHNLRCDCGGGLDKHILFVGNDFLGQYAFENAEANAEFIVKACNNYDKLVEMLKTISNSLAFQVYHHPNECDERRLKEANDLLSQMEEEK